MSPIHLFRCATPAPLVALFVLLCGSASAEQVVFSEIQYHPQGAEPEFIEIFNLTGTPFDIARWKLSDGVDFEFPEFVEGDADRTFLQPFERVLVSAVDEAALRSAYTIPAETKIYGPWIGVLNNGGERIVLEDKNGTVMAEISYGDDGRKWPIAADGAGHTLQLLRENHGASDWRNWGQSELPGGSPGLVAIPLPQTEFVKLSEVHFDIYGNIDWIELHAPGESAVDAGGLSVSSLADFSDAVALSGSIPAGGYMSWDASFPVADNGKVDIFVTMGGGVQDAHRFDRDSGEESFQSLPPGGEWYGGTGSTRDSANAPSRVTDIVINEIMYDAPSDGRIAEFVELFNKGASPVDLSGWRFVDGVSFTFPGGTTIAAGGYLVIAADAAWMANAYGGIPVIGNFSGQLRDSGELLRLEDAMGNLVDQVDYLPAGDWPELADGDGSSLELRHPDMDNAVASAWSDSDEANKTTMQPITYVADFERATWNPITSGQELHLHLVGDGHVIVENVSFKLDGGGSNLIPNADVMSPTASSASGWVCQGTHWASFMDTGKLNLIADGHGDNKANRAEIDLGTLAFDQSYTLSFNARWVSGKSRMIAQTLDHGFGTSFRLPIPDDLGTPGAANSSLEASPVPAVSAVVHSPAVPSTSDNVVVTANVSSPVALDSVEVVHRLDTATGDGAWLRATMSDDGSTGGDVRAGDGIYTATLNQYKTQANIVQFYVEAVAAGGGATMLPKLGPARPAMWIVDDREMPDTLMRERFIVSQYDRNAMVAASGGGAAYDYNFPRMSNHFFNATFISNENEVFYTAEIRKSGSPFTRDSGNSLAHGKWKLPGDRLFRERRRSVFDASGTSEGSGTPRFYDDRIARYFLYLLGHPTNEMEFVHWVVNGDAFKLRENHEPISNDFMSRNWEDGTEGTLLRIDDEWRFTSDDGNARQARNADWSYKDSDNPVRYHSEWIMRSREADHDYSNFVEFVRTLDADNFDETTISRMADRDMLCLNAAVRGYDADWDTLTVNRGKNAYFYRPKGGRWMLIHWDGDRVFQNTTQAILGGRTGIPTYFNKPYNKRVMNYYLTELLTKYTKDSARTEAWMDMEVAAVAGSGITMTKSHYVSWFTNREPTALSFIGAPLSASFAISTSNASTADNSITLAGTAPSDVYDVRVVGRPWVASFWADTSGWSLLDIGLMTGENVITVEGVNHEGVVVHTEVFTITKTGDAPPVMALESSPASLNVAVGELLSLDASGSSDPEGGALTFAWQVDPSVDATLSGNGALATASFSRPGHYLLTVTGTDTATNSTPISRQVSVYGGEGFSRFNSAQLEPFWSGVNIEPINNSFGGPWYSLESEFGRLLISVPGDRKYPLGLVTDLPPLVSANYISMGESWAYDDSNVDRGSEFVDPAYDDSSWSTGSGIFGFDSGTFPAPGRQTPLAKDNTNNLLTYYFRKEFQFDDDPIGAQVSIEAMLDDGARFWINGMEVEAARVRMPETPVAEGWWKTPASSNTPSGDEKTLLPVTTVDGSGLLVTGTNLIAVDLHNGSSGSSDAVFDMELDIASRALPSGGDGGLDDTIHPWVKRDLPAVGDWSLQTDLELSGLQFGDFMAGLMVEIDSGGERSRYAFGYRGGDELAVVKVTSAATTGDLFSLPYALSDDMVIRIRREGDDLVFEWRSGDLFMEVYRTALATGSTASEGGPFASTESLEILNVSFDYVMLIDPSSVASAAEDLVITEVMYKPEGGESYEYIELYNKGAAAIDLTGFRFPQGQPFDEFVFGNVSIGAGEYLLVVNDLTAFRSRYGTGLDPIIGGEWAGGVLSNSGEVITLLDAGDNIVLTLEYSDQAPWPTSPDVDGTSLVLSDAQGGNSSIGTDWAASALVGGSPGSNDDVSQFDAWMAARGETNPLATKPGEPVSNLLSYGLGYDLSGGDPGVALPQTSVIEVEGSQYLSFEYRRRLGDPTIGYQVEISRDASSWEDADADIIEVGVAAEGDGTERVIVRLTSTFDAQPGCLLRLSVTAP